MLVNLGKFRDNGGSGYILKPKYMIDDSAKPQTKTLKIKVLSGQQLPKPAQSSKGEVIDPYVEIEIIGNDADSTKLKTKTVQDNGFNPAWDQELEFTLTDSELALINITVMDQDLDKDDFIAYCMIPFNCLGQGYRHVRLLDTKNNSISLASLYVFIDIK